MSVAYKSSVRVTDNATPALDALIAKCSTKRLAAILGPELTKVTQNHLRANGQNKKGWPTTHFWADAARATNWQASGDYLFININKIGVRQRFYGGVIEPVSAKALAIPISPVSYGHVPSDFPGLFLLKCKAGAYLVQATNVASAAGKFAKRKDSGNKARRLNSSLTFLFKLVASVTQQPDPGCIPSQEQLAVAGKARLVEALTA